MTSHVTESSCGSVAQSGMACDRRPGFGASRWVKQTMASTNRNWGGREANMWKQVETYPSTSPSAAPSRPGPVTIPCLHSDSRPVSQGMRVDRSSRVETRAKIRYCRIGCGGGAGKVDHDCDGVQGLAAFLAIGEGGLSFGECDRECDRGGVARARNSPTTIKRTRRNKR